MDSINTWFWVIIALVMIVIELITVGNLITIWFAIGAIAAFVTHLLLPNLLLEAIVFGIVSVVSLLLIRPLAAKALKGNTIATNADRIIGQHIRLTTAVSADQWGSAHVFGTVWSVASIDQKPIPAEALVEVVAIEGVKLIVKEIH